jgi:hypothetical protein
MENVFQSPKLFSNTKTIYQTYLNSFSQRPLFFSLKLVPKGMAGHGTCCK